MGVTTEEDAAWANEQFESLMADDPLGAIMGEVVSHFLTKVQPALDAFAEKHCSKFSDVKDDVIFLGTQSSTSEDLNLEHHKLFEEYVKVFEGLMEDFLSSRGVTTEQFVAKCSQSKQDKEKYGIVNGDAEFMDLLCLVDDYSGFLVYMRDTYDDTLDAANYAMIFEQDLEDATKSERAPIRKAKRPPKRDSTDKPTLYGILPEAVTYFVHVIQPTLEKFSRKHCHLFAEIHPEDEHPLDQYNNFTKYQVLFEYKMEEFLTSKGVSLEEFVLRCKEEHETGPKGSSFLDQMAIFDNFSQYSVMMNDMYKETQ